MKKSIKLVSLAITLALIGAGAFALVFLRMPGSSFGGDPPALSAGELESAEYLRKHVRKLAGEVGQRNRAAAGSLEASSRYIARTLEQHGYEVIEQAYQTSRGAGLNIAGETRDTEDDALVVGAHYDTVPGSPGADDNASGVAVVLELARLRMQRSNGRGVRFVAFADEESPYYSTDAMGSRRYARELAAKGAKPRGMLSIESVGYYTDREGSQGYPLAWLRLIYPPSGSFVAFVADLGSRGLLKRSIGTFRSSATLPSEGASLPAGVPGIAWSDHASFWEIGVPAIMVTDTAPFRNPHYHEPSDTPDRLDYEKMARLTTGLMAVIEELAG